MIPGGRGDLRLCRPLDSGICFAIREMGIDAK